MNITIWANAVLELLRAANVRQALLAKSLGLKPPTLNRYLKDERTPEARIVAHINRAVARLAGHPNVGLYLDCEAMLCGLLDPSRSIPLEILQYARFALDTAEGVQFRPTEAKTPVLSADHSMLLDGLIGGVLTLLNHYAPLFRSGYRDEISAFMRAVGETAARKFAVEVNRAFQRIILAELLPPPSAPVGFASVCDVLKRYKITVELTEHGESTLALEHVQWTVRRELAHANSDASSKERIASEKRIFDALNKRFDLQLKAHDAQPHTKGKRS